MIRGTDKSFVAQLREAAPDGIDVFLDNVGGEQLQAAVAVAREHARFVITGTLSGQLAAAGTGRVAPVVLDSTQILLRKITIRGYSADDNPEARDEWFRRLADWCRSGDIALPHVVIDGLEQATLALADTARGRYFGMVVIRL